MSSRFVNVDRLTPLLFPPDLRDWVQAEDLVHFVLDAVEILPLQGFRVNRRGTGSEQYPPRMMLALLIYSYATGTFSSRAIEGLTYSHVSVRYLCANTHPDHDTICRFRVENKALLEEMFVKVLELAAELKLARVGTVAIDGTKVAAAASKHGAVSYGHAGKLIQRLQEEVQALLLKAQAADSVPLKDGLSIPEEIARREERQQKLRAARVAIEARFAQQHAAEQVAYEAKIEARRAKRERGVAVRGREPKPPATEPDAKMQYNFTDPESRIMKAGNGPHFEQAYNAQAAVDTQSLLIVGQRVSNAPNDKEQLQPTVASIPASLGQPDAAIADAGFFNASQIEAVENQGQGNGSITVYAAVQRMSHNRPLAEYEAHPEPPMPPADAPLAERMCHRLNTPAGKAIYKLRKQTVEPVFGIIKEVLGFRRFSLRGESKTSSEWTLVCLAWNMKRLHTLGMGAMVAKTA